MKAAGIIGIVATVGGIATVAVILATGSCKQKEPEFAGVGHYRFGHTTRADIKNGVCQPTKIDDGKRDATWCFSIPPYKIANRVAEIELYFDGPMEKMDAPLIEIQLKIRGCVDADLESWLRTSFGAPIEQKSTRSYYQNSFLWAAALIPEQPGRCRVHLVPLSETLQISKIKAY